MDPNRKNISMVLDYFLEGTAMFFHQDNVIGFLNVFEHVVHYSNFVVLIMIISKSTIRSPSMATIFSMASDTQAL